MATIAFLRQAALALPPAALEAGFYLDENITLGSPLLMEDESGVVWSCYDHPSISLSTVADFATVVGNQDLFEELPEEIEEQNQWHETIIRGASAKERAKVLKSLLPPRILSLEPPTIEVEETYYVTEKEEVELYGETYTKDVTTEHTRVVEVEDPEWDLYCAIIEVNGGDDALSLMWAGSNIPDWLTPVEEEDEEDDLSEV